MWLGDRPPPLAAMRTWEQKHRGWRYMFWSEKTIRKEWPSGLYNQAQFDAIGEHCGKHDVAQYEILYRFGGVFADADSVCIRPLDDFLLVNDSFACYENEWARGNLVANGFLATTRNNELARLLVEGIHRRSGEPLWHGVGTSWMTVGPKYLTEVILANRYTRIAIYPSFFFLPRHYTGVGFAGPAVGYADHWWETTQGRRDEGMATGGVVPLTDERPTATVLVGGMHFKIRTGTADEAILREAIEGDFYHFSHWSPLRPPRFIVDIGAHIGGFTAWAAKRFPKAAVFGFECDAGNARLARENARACPKALIVHAAVLGAGRAEAVEVVDVVNTGMRRVRCCDSTSEAQTPGLSTVTLEQAMEQYGMDRIDFLKMDCEGSEWSILRGGAGSALERVDCLAMELHCRDLDGRTQQRMTELLGPFFGSIKVERNPLSSLARIVATSPRRRSRPQT